MVERDNLNAAVDGLRSLVKAQSVGLTATERTELLGTLTEVVQQLATAPAAEEHYADRRVEELLEAVRAIGRHEFPVSVPVTERWDAFDVLATGINMVAEELEIALRERSQALGVLDAAGAWFEEMFATVPYMVTVVACEPGPVFRVLMTNGSGFGAIGLDGDTAVGKTLTEIFGAEEGALTRRHLTDIVRRGKTTNYVRTFDSPDGGKVNFEVTGTPIVTGGQCSHLVLLSRGIDTKAPIHRLDELLSSLTDRVALAPDAIMELLTKREAEVLAIMSTGTLADRAIAEALGISPATARTHVRNIMAKVDVHDRRDLLGLALHVER